MHLLPPLSVAAEGPPPFLTQLVVGLVLAALIGYTCVRLRVVPILGFLLAGVAIGPNALGVVRERELIDAAAEIGVILLLFTIGIEFSLGRLMAIRRLVLLGGAAQTASAIALVTGLLVALDVDLRSAVFTGFLVSLSSTAIVLKLLADRGATGSRTGQAALGLLIFQDLAVVVMVLVLPVLGGDGGTAADLARPLLVAAAVIAVTLLVARRVMPPLLEGVARACSPEVFLLSVIALCLGTAYLTALAGVSLSLGAFLAGLVVSESRHSAHALGEILPLQILFSAVFFLSIGSLLDVGFLVREPLLVLAAIALVVVVKAVTTTAAAWIAGVGLATAGSVGLLLAQVGEFAFVLERAGREQGLTPAGLGEDGSQAFLAATVLLLLATPGLAAGGRRVAGLLAPRATAPGQRAGTPAAEDGAPDGHVLLSGWGSGARHVAGDLVTAGIPVMVITLSPDGAAEAEGLGLTVVRGDSLRSSVLLLAGVDRARAVVIADDDPQHAATIAGVVTSLAATTPVIVRSPDEDSVADLYAAGVAKVVLTDRASGRSLTAAVFDELPEVALGRPSTGGTVVDVSEVVDFHADPESACVHAGVARPVLPSDPGCHECTLTGQSWVHLRMCVSCGHVGCCDSSPHRHAAAHAKDADHPVMRSVEPREDWGWCYLDQTRLTPAPVAA